MPLAKPDPLQRVIVDAALEIASGVGPDAISMRELARQAKVSHQAPYHHFGDRAGIFAAICEEGFAILGDEMYESRNLGAEALCESYVRFALNHRGHFRVMFRTDLCDMASYPNAAIQADRAFGILYDEVVAMVGLDADESTVQTQTAYMWSVAHGLSTLLIDGPLLKKIGSVEDMDQLIKNVARMAISSIGV
jgi:AcrR family transcriptional regulator